MKIAFHIQSVPLVDLMKLQALVLSQVNFQCAAVDFVAIAGVAEVAVVGAGVVDAAAAAVAPSGGQDKSSARVEDEAHCMHPIHDGCGAGRADYHYFGVELVKCLQLLGLCSNQPEKIFLQKQVLIPVQLFDCLMTFHRTYIDDELDAEEIKADLEMLKEVATQG